MSDPILLFASILEEFNNDSKWAGATLGKIKIISNTKVGNVGQMFMEKLCDDLSIPFSFPLDIKGQRSSKSPWDIKIGNIEFELKTATEDVNNSFQFNHIRYHRKYQALLCLGVTPNNLYFGIWSKGDVTTGKAGSLVSMEKSANASYKLTKKSDQLHDITKFKQVIDKFLKDFKRKGN